MLASDLLTVVVVGELLKDVRVLIGKDVVTAAEVLDDEGGQVPAKILLGHLSYEGY